MSRVFLSHSSRDNERALEVRDWLARNGWDDVFLDVDPAGGLAPGERWQNALKAAADRCEAVLFLISPNWLKSAWCLSEFLLAKQLGKRLFPILIDGASIEGLPNEIASDHQAVDLAGDPLGWDRLREGLRRAGLDANSFPFPKGRRPYPGFEPLNEEDAGIFFGREAQILRGLDRLRLMRDAGAERMMVVLGASGAGKSSFLRAGLWPRLWRDDRNFWPLPTIRPERAVLSGKSGLCAALEVMLANPRIASRPELAAFPRARGALGTVIAREGGLAEILSAIRQAEMQRLAHTGAPAPVLLIDQAEELFNEEGRAESERFFEILTQTLEQEKNLIVVLAIRSDAFPQFQAKQALISIPREPFDLAQMPEGSLRLVIEGPAKLAVPPLKLEPALVDALLMDLTGQDALPLLAFTLDRLSREYGAQGILTLDNYVSGGGVRGVITAAVDEALADGRRRGIAPADPKALEGLLKQAFIPHLARVNEAGEFARRIAYAHEIPALARPLIDLLVEARLLTRDRDEDGEIIEVAHEALLREWPLLRGFLEADREFLVSKRQIADDLKIWQEAPPKGKPDALLTGLRLTRAQHLLSERSAQDLTDNERVFIGESVKAAESTRRRRNIFVAAVIALLTAFSGLAATQWINATREAKIAQANKEEAQHSADDARKAEDQAEKNAKKAETNEARARGAQAKAQIQESASLADQSLRQTASGDVIGAMRTALAALPHDPAKPDRPYVPRAEYALAKAYLTKRLEAAITPAADWVNQVVYNRDGSQFAMGTRDGLLKVYDAKTARELNSENQRRLAVMALAYSGDGKRLAAAYQDPPSLIVKDVASGKTIRNLRLNALPNRILLTHDGSKAIVISQGNEARPTMLDLNDDEAKIRVLDSPAQLRDNSSSPRTVSISPDDRLLLLVSYNGVFVWELQRGSLVATSLDIGPSTAKFDFSKMEEEESIDGGAFLEGKTDAVLIGKRNVYVVDPKTATIKSNKRYAEEWQVTSARAPLLSPDGSRIVFAVNNRTLATYSLTDWQQLAKREVPSDITNAAISPDGKIVAVACADMIVRAWPVESVAAIGVFPGHRGRLRGLTFSPDGTHMISSGDNTARVWDLREVGERLNALPPGWQSEVTDTQLTVASVSKTDSKATDDNGPRAGILKLSQTKPVASQAVTAFLQDRATPAAFSRSGKWLVIQNEYSPVDNPARLKDISAILTNLMKEARDRNDPIETKPGEDLTALAIVDTETGKATQVLLTRREKPRSGNVAFISDDGGVLGLTNEDYGNGDEATSSAEIWDISRERKSLSISQDGYDPTLSYSPAGHCVIFTTSLKKNRGNHTASIWNIATGSMIAKFDRPAGYDADENAAAALSQRDRILLGDAGTKPMLAECSTGKEVGAIAGTSLAATRLTMSADRRRMLVESVGAARSLWNLDNNKNIGPIPDSKFDWSNAFFSENGKRIVTRGRSDGLDTIGVFDSETGERLKSFPNMGALRDFYPGMTGARVAMETNSVTVEIREVAADTPPVTIMLEGNLRRWRFSASDERLVTADESGRLELWDVHTGNRIFEFAGAHTVEPLGGAPLAGTHIPLLLATGGAALLDTLKGEITWSLPDLKDISGLQLAPDEKSIIVTEPDRISLFALDQPTPVATLPVALGEKAFFDYNKNGDRVEIYVRGADGGVGVERLFDVPGRKEIAHFDNARMTAIAAGAPYSAFATQKAVSFLNTETGALLREVEFSSPIQRLDFSLGGDRLAVLTNDSKVWALNVNEGAPTLVASLRQHPTWMRFAADPAKMLLYETSSQATLRDTATGNILTSFAVDWTEKASNSSHWIERLDPSGAFMAVRSPDNFIRVFRTQDGANISDLNWDDNGIIDMAFSSDARHLLFVTEKGRFANWDVAARKSTSSLVLPREYTAYDSVTLKRTPDPSQMLAIDHQGQVDLYSFNTNSVRNFYPGEPEENVNAALSPDGSILAVIGAGDMLRLWHVGAREILAELPMEHDYPLTKLRFSPDGRNLAVSKRDRIKLVRVPLLGDALLSSAIDLISHSPVPQADTAQAARTYRLGVFMRDVSAEVATRHHLPATQGAEVIEVFSDSAAQAAGIRTGDVIVKIGGNPVTNVAETTAAIKDAHLDLSLDLIRDGTAVVTHAVLDD